MASLGGCGVILLNKTRHGFTRGVGGGGGGCGVILLNKTRHGFTGGCGVI